MRSDKRRQRVHPAALNGGAPEWSERQSKLRFRDWRFRVRDMLAALRNINAYTRGMTYAEFAADRRTTDAVLHNLMTMGESIRWIPKPVLDVHPEVPWRQLHSVRNVIVHEYFGIDKTILWETVRGDLPPLVDKLEAVLKS